jgi:hypothetical protein
MFRVREVRPRCARFCVRVKGVISEGLQLHEDATRAPPPRARLLDKSRLLLVFGTNKIAKNEGDAMAGVGTLRFFESSSLEFQVVIFLAPTSRAVAALAWSTAARPFAAHLVTNVPCLSMVQST